MVSQAAALPGADRRVEPGKRDHEDLPDANHRITLVEARRCATLRRASRLLALLAGLVGLAVLTGGWILDVPALRSIIPGAASMKVNTALGLMLTASAILLEDVHSQPLRRLAPVFALGLVLVSLATLIEDFSGWNFGIDQLFVADRTPPVLVTAPGRMSITTAISFLLLGCALLAGKRRQRLLWNHFLALGAAVLCLANLIGYIYGISNFTGIAFYTGMAIHTSSSLVILSLSVLASHPDGGLMAIVTRESLGSLLTRRLLPAAVVVPVFLGWLTWQGELNGLYGTAFGLALYATANVLVFGYLTMTAGWRLNWMEGEKAEAAALLKAREDLLTIFVRHVPAAVAMLDRDMRYLQVSDRWCTDFKLDGQELLGRSHYEIFPDLPERWKKIHRRVLAGETLRAEEDRWERAGVGVSWLRWETRPWGPPDRPPEGILIFSEDITERKRIEEALRETEATTRALLETAAQAILAVNNGGSIAIANRMAGEMFGYAHSELIGQPLELLLPERYRTSHVAHRAEFASNPMPRAMGSGLELVARRKDGTEFPIEVSLSSVQTAHGMLSVSFVSDITARKQASLALRDSEQQLRALAGSLLTAQEDERRRLSRELHDDVTQRLAFLSIELGTLTGQVPVSDEETRTKIRALQHQTLQMSNEVRRLSRGLHPSVIEDFGLSVALEDFCEEFARAQGITVRFEGPVEDSQLTADGATCLYRVAQESLRNAVIHGQATDVRVALTTDGGAIHLCVRDNGSGFTTDGIRIKNGLGIVSMRERIRLVGGALAFRSQPGQGTEVTASVRLSGGKHE